MPDAAGRTLVINRPWRTAEQQANRVARLVALVATLQFLLGAIQPWVSQVPMTALWLLSAMTVAAASVRIEKYFARQRRLGR